ncbi:MAG: hypothetical protein AAFP84_09050 [Actinomycetota bacterium]
MSTETTKKLIALAIGMASITAGLLTWRASQINSTAAFDDRTAVGQTITQAQRRINVTIDASVQAAAYSDYVTALDLAERVDEPESLEIRTEATELAIAAGVFPAFGSSDPAANGIPPFDLDARLASLAAEQETGFASGGRLDPTAFADESDAIRDRVRALQIWTLVILLAIGALTAAEITDSRRTRRGAGAAGMFIYLAATTAALTGSFFG